MEIPLWILAISQVLIDLLVVILLVALIVAIVAIKKAITSLTDKANDVLDDVKEVSDYVKDSKVVSVLKLIFAPSKNPIRKLFKRAGGKVKQHKGKWDKYTDGYEYDWEEHHKKKRRK